MSYGLVYHYFGSKEVLFEIIVESWWNDLYTMMDREINADSPTRDKLVNIIEFFLDTYGQKPNLMSIFVSEVCRSSVYHTEEGLSRFLKFFSLCEQIMLQGQESGFLSREVPPHHLTYIFYGAIETFITVMVLGCLLYTSDAADDLLCVDLGGRRIIKKKKIKNQKNYRP